MPFVERRNGRVIGIFENAQPGYAEEFLSDDHADLQPSADELAEIAAKEAQAAADAQAIAAARADAVVQQLVSHTPAEIVAYVRNQVNADAVSNVATAKASIAALVDLVAKLAAAFGAAQRDKLR